MARVCERFDELGALDSGRTFNLGVMGGTFDPIHIGHLAAAEQARDAFGLDCVVFVPANVQPFKVGMRITSPEDRLAMCRLATASNPFFDVSAIEIERGGRTYTVDTLRELRAHYPDNVRLHFITGADAMLSIAKWRDSSEIARLARLIAVTRPGYELTNEAKEGLAGFDAIYLEMTALSVSSSMLHSMVRQGRSIRYLTPLSVFDYISAKGLYLE